MKAAFEIDTQELEARITSNVINALKPHLEAKPDKDIIFDVETLSEYICESPSWIYKRKQLSEIPYIQTNGKKSNLKFRKSEIDEWLDSMRTPVMDPSSPTPKRLKKEAATG